MLISREGDLVTLINVFETKPEQQQALIDQWLGFFHPAIPLLASSKRAH